MASLVLERTHELTLREIEVPAALGPHDVRIKMHTVGICGSDVHYYTHGAIGPYVVREPMVLGHEGAGTVVEVGAAVSGLRAGDRVCMEPGIPDPNSKATRLGLYNLDPGVRFWATPPVHGCLTPYVVHPAAFTFKLPDNVSFAEGAMVEAVGGGNTRGDQGEDQGWRPGGSAGRGHDWHGDGARRARRWMQPRDNHRRARCQAGPGEAVGAYCAGQRGQGAPWRRRQASV